MEDIEINETNSISDLGNQRMLNHEFNSLYSFCFQLLVSTGNTNTVKDFSHELLYDVLHS